MNFGFAWRKLRPLKSKNRTLAAIATTQNLSKQPQKRNFEITTNTLLSAHASFFTCFRANNSHSPRCLLIKPIRQRETSADFPLGRPLINHNRFFGGRRLPPPKPWLRSAPSSDFVCEYRFIGLNLSVGRSKILCGAGCFFLLNCFQVF